MGGAQLMHHMQKVKAHQTPPTQETPQARVRRLGNEWADALAKQGADMHPGPDPGMAAIMKQAWHDATTACRVLGSATHLWPDAAGMKDGQRRQPTTRAERAQRSGQALSSTRAPTASNGSDTRSRWAAPVGTGR